jgi:hypothetical protein
MIIDLILDRKDGAEYVPRDFYNAVCEYEDIFESLGFNISRAMDGDSELSVKKVLCEYIINNGYSIDITEYIYSVNWLEQKETKQFCLNCGRLSECTDECKKTV